MATWWRIEFEGDPTEADLEHVADLVKDGFTSGQLIEDKETPVSARKIEVTYDCPVCGGEGWLPSLPEGQSGCMADGCKDGKVTEQRSARRALVFQLHREMVEAYLPSNYKVLRWVDGGPGGWLIEGYDKAGWTLDGYVIPRLASGLIRAEEAE